MRDAPKPQRLHLILGASLAAGFLVSLLPAASLLVAGALLFYYRDKAIDLALQLTTPVPEVERIWRPGRNVWRVLVWGTSLTFAALGLLSLVAA